MDGSTDHSDRRAGPALFDQFGWTKSMVTEGVVWRLGPASAAVMTQLQDRVGVGFHLDLHRDELTEQQVDLLTQLANSFSAEVIEASRERQQAHGERLSRRETSKRSR